MRVLMFRATATIPNCHFNAWLKLLWLSAYTYIFQEIEILCGEDELCVYQCHCNSCYGPDGRCPDHAKCNIGWFGSRCQYRDLLTIPRTKTESRTWLTDRDDSTCNNDTNLQEVTVSWPETYPVMGLRMVLNDSSMFSSIKIVYNTSGEFKECENQTWSQLDENTMDIRCEGTVITTTVKILGNITSLCSLYINGGRNVAYKQPTTQSSTYREDVLCSSDLAVDGNTNNKLEAGSCSHTDDPRAQFILTFSSLYFVKQYILYNRAGFTAPRLQGFLLLSFDEKNNSVENITDPYTDVQIIYFIIASASKPIQSLSISATRTNYFDNFPILTLCEVEAYGECPPGKWSLPCTQNCSTSCPISCDRDTGLCNTVCFGFSNPPACTNKCLNSTWGVNCNQNCSSQCVNNTCTARNGACYGGCKAGYQLPDCIRVNKNNDRLPRQITIAIAVSVALAALLTTIACLIVLKVKGELCFERKEKGQQLTDLPIIQGDEGPLDKEEKHKNKEYCNIDENGISNISNVYSNLDNQQLENQTYEALKPKNATHL